MGREVLCRKCGKVIGTVGSGGRYRDLRHPVLAQLCDGCVSIVSKEFDRRFRQHTGGYEPTDENDRYDLEKYRIKKFEETRVQSNYDLGDPVCDKCGKKDWIQENGCCYWCNREEERETDGRRQEWEEARKRARKTDFNNL